jgi:hypothetical protein
MSLSLDFTALLGNASDIINGLWPVFIFPVGIALGIGLLNRIVTMINRML